MSLPAHFWAKTRQTDCIVWAGAQNSKGYGCFLVDGVSQLTHRLAWEDARGPIPDGLTIDHLCRVRCCVNVEHMELVSVAENVRRAPRNRGIGDECRNGHSLLLESDIYRRENGTAECRQCRRDSKARTRARALTP